jgi:hypothetical protein
VARPSVETIDPERVSIPGAARILGYSESYTRALADAGVIPCTRSPTGTRIFLVADLQRHCEFRALNAAKKKLREHGA